MTTQQTKILNDIILLANIRKNSGNSEAAIWKYVCGEISKILFLEENGKRQGKLNLYDFTDKKGIRPACAGVFHDNDYLVANDGIAMVMIPNSPDDPNVGKIIDNVGQLVDGTYPKYKSVIPSDDRLTPLFLSADSIKDYISKAKVAKKMNEPSLYLEIPGCENTLSLKNADRLHKFMREYPSCELFAASNGTMVMAKDASGAMFFSMLTAKV